jgi:putative PIN family toxin of toxin-antitoxin system
MWRLVLDTSVIVAGLRSRRGASAALLGLVAERLVRPLVTIPLFLEYEQVLKRPEHRIIAGLSESDIDLLLAAFADAAEPVDLHFRWRPQTPDPADEMVLEAAINGQADALVTHDIRHLAAGAARFGILVWRPAEAMERIRS